MTGGVTIARVGLVRAGADICGAREGHALGRLEVVVEPPGASRAFVVAPKGDGFRVGWMGEEVDEFIESYIADLTTAGLVIVRCLWHSAAEVVPQLKVVNPLRQGTQSGILAS